jgi:hypothetical protein
MDLHETMGLRELAHFVRRTVRKFVSWCGVKSADMSGASMWAFLPVRWRVSW